LIQAIKLLNEQLIHHYKIKTPSLKHLVNFEFQIQNIFSDAMAYGCHGITYKNLLHVMNKDTISTEFCVEKIFVEFHECTGPLVNIRE